jgi:hypothetical protein
MAPAPARALGAGDCEAWGHGLLGQPTNALTSLAFVAAGVRLARRARTTTTAVGRPPRPPHVFAALLAATGVGSFAYHGVGGAPSRWLHDLSLYALLGTVACEETRHRWTTRSSVTAPAAGGHDRHGGGGPRSSTRRVGPAEADRSRSVVAAGLVVAPLAYLLGRTASPACRPTSAWQWHGVWHVAAAVTAAAWANTVWGRSGTPTAGTARP